MCAALLSTNRVTLLQTLPNMYAYHFSAHCLQAFDQQQQLLQFHARKCNTKALLVTLLKNQVTQGYIGQSSFSFCFYARKGAISRIPAVFNFVTTEQTKCTTKHSYGLQIQDPYPGRTNP